ncbi:hypothetical protein ES707_11658 [subsurface metagenome]
MGIYLLIGLVLIGLGIAGASTLKAINLGNSQNIITKGPTTWDYLFIRYSRYPDIAKAVCRVESNFKQDAVGDSGRAHGLMQIWLPTAKGYGFLGASGELVNPEHNIKYACAFLDDMIDKYGVERGIMAYNLGETKIRKGYTVASYLNKVQVALA